MTSRPFRCRWRTQTFRANLRGSLCDVRHTNGLDFGLQIYHVRDEYIRKQVGDYYAVMCSISRNISLRLEAVVNKWTNRETRGLIGGSVPLTFAEDANYINTWVQMYELVKNVSIQQMSRSVRCKTLQSRTVALRWLFSCWKQAWSAVTWPIAERSCQVTGDQLFG